MGSPQGAVISPLLSNIYLNPLDHLMAQQGFEMIRYADDFVIMCRSPEEAARALAVVQAWTASAGLTLHPNKTRIIDAREDAFEFLGYRFVGETLPSSQESDKAQGHNPSEDQADIWQMPSGHYPIVEPDAAWLVWILQAQLQDDVFRAGRLDSDEAAKHPPETQRSQRTWSRFRSSSLAECLLCRSRAV